MFGGCLEKFLKATLWGNQGVYLKCILDFEIELSNAAGYFGETLGLGDTSKCVQLAFRWYLKSWTGKYHVGRECVCVRRRRGPRTQLQAWQHLDGFLCE